MLSARFAAGRGQEGWCWEGLMDGRSGLAIHGVGDVQEVDTALLGVLELGHALGGRRYPGWAQREI